jgi:hypothetical protein
VLPQVTDERSVADAEEVVRACLTDKGLTLKAIINNAGIAGRGMETWRPAMTTTNLSYLKAPSSLCRPRQCSTCLTYGICTYVIYFFNINFNMIIDFFR